MNNPNIIRSTQKQAKNFWDQYKNAVKKVPEALVLEVTTECNWAKCAHCYMDAKPQGRGELISLDTIEIWFSEISQSDKKPELIWVTGGEPLLHPDIITILTIIKQKGFKPVLVSNAELFSGHKYDDVIEFLHEVEISIRGNNYLHDLMMLPINHKIWDGISTNASFEEQLSQALKNKGSKSAPHFERTVKGIENIIRLRGNNKTPLITLLVDIQKAADLRQIVLEFQKRGIKIDNIELQVQFSGGRAERTLDKLPNLWRKPTLKIVQDYLKQAEIIRKEKLIQGDVFMIDPVPKEIEDELNLKSEKYSWFYNPIAVPSITVDGTLRTNVLILE